MSFVDGYLSGIKIREMLNAREKEEQAKQAGLEALEPVPFNDEAAATFNEGLPETDQVTPVTDAVSDYKFNPKKHVANLQKKGLTDIAATFEKHYQEVEANQRKMEDEDRIRKYSLGSSALDLAIGGDEEGAKQLWNKANPTDPVKNFKLIGKNKIRVNQVDGGTVDLDVEQFRKAAVAETTKFQEHQAWLRHEATLRAELEKAKSTQKLTPNGILAQIITKQLYAENLATQNNLPIDEIYKQRPELKLLPTEQELIDKHELGNVLGPALQGLNQNPEMFRFFLDSLQNPEGSTNKLVDMITNMRNAIKESNRPKQPSPKTPTATTESKAKPLPRTSDGKIDKSKLEKGVEYETSKGNAKWDGENFTIK